MFQRTLGVQDILLSAVRRLSMAGDNIFVVVVLRD